MMLPKCCSKNLLKILAYPPPGQSHIQSLGASFRRMLGALTVGRAATMIKGVEQEIDVKR